MYGIPFVQLGWLASIILRPTRTVMSRSFAVAKATTVLLVSLAAAYQVSAISVLGDTPRGTYSTDGAREFSHTLLVDGMEADLTFRYDSFEMNFPSWSNVGTVNVRASFVYSVGYVDRRGRLDSSDQFTFNRPFAITSYPEGLQLVRVTWERQDNTIVVTALREIQGVEFKHSFLLYGPTVTAATDFDTPAEANKGKELARAMCAAALTVAAAVGLAACIGYLADNARRSTDYHRGGGHRGTTTVEHHHYGCGPFDYCDYGHPFSPFHRRRWMQPRTVFVVQDDVRPSTFHAGRGHGIRADPPASRGGSFTAHNPKFGSTHGNGLNYGTRVN